jgi:hypothetical protein
MTGYRIWCKTILYNVMLQWNVNKASYFKYGRKHLNLIGLQIHGARLNTKQRNCHCVQNREECVIQQDLKVIILSFIIFTKLENSDLNILIKAKKPMQAY